MMPVFVDNSMFEQAKALIQKKKPIMKDKIDSIHFTTICEKKAVQMLHIGPFSEEIITKKILEKFMEENNLTQKEIAVDMIHHEIYLSDYRKTTPTKLKTILRFPVK